MSQQLATQHLSGISSIFVLCSRPSFDFSSHSILFLIKTEQWWKQSNPPHHRASPLILMPQSSTNPFIAHLPSLLSVSVFCIYGRIADMSTTSEMVDMTIKEQEPKNKQTCHCKRRQKFQLDSNSNKQQIELSQIQIQSFLMIKAKGCQVPQLSYLMNWNVLSRILSRYPTILYRWQRLPSSCLGTWDKAHLK